MDFPPTILTIPSELLLEILQHLDYREILKCKTVSKYFRQIVEGSLEMQYMIELGVDGMVDGARTPGSMSTAERYELLLDRRARWRTLHWAGCKSIPLAGFCSAYELVGGVFAKTMGNTNAEGVAARHLTAISLPTRSSDESILTRDDLGVPTRDFAIDPSQDLIALVEINDVRGPGGNPVYIHLRSISTNATHKLAGLPVLECRAPGQVTSCFVQIVDDVVGLFFWLQGPTLMIWNWRTGKLVVHCTADAIEDSEQVKRNPGLPQLPRETWDFAFLNNRAYLVNSIRGRGLIYIYSFDGNGEPQTAPKLCTTLAMPAISRHSNVHHFATHSAPFLAGDSTKGKPFTTDERGRIYMMTITYGPAARYHLFVKSEFLESFIPKHEFAGLLIPKYIDWHRWGPDNTRFIDNLLHYQWLRYVHGYRIILPPTPAASGTWPTNRQTIRVYDFNVYPRRRNDPTFSRMFFPKETDWRIIIEPGFVPKEDLFEENVVTNLPYGTCERKGKFNYSGFMIDEERLVGMKSSTTADEGDLSSIDVFTF